LTATRAEGAGAFATDLLAGASDVDAGETADRKSVGEGKGVDGGGGWATQKEGVSRAGRTLTVDPSGAVFDDLAVGDTRVITVSYDVKDAQGVTVAQTAKITIVCTDDRRAVSTWLTATRAEGAGAFATDLLAGASDVDAGET